MTASGVTYAGPGWSVPAELWPAAVTRGRPNWRRPRQDAMTPNPSREGVSRSEATTRPPGVGGPIPAESRTELEEKTE